MRGVVWRRRLERLEKVFLPEPEEEVRMIWGSEEEGTAYGIDLIGQGEQRRSVAWRQWDETWPEEMPPPPPEFWETYKKGQGIRDGGQEEVEERGSALRFDEEQPAADPVMRDHLAKFEPPKKGTPWDGRSKLATEPRRGRKPGLRYGDGGEQWAVLE